MSITVVKPDEFFLEKSFQSKHPNFKAAAKKYLNKNRRNPFPAYSFFIDKNAYCDTSDYPNSLRELAIKSINDQRNGR